MRSVPAEPGGQPVRADPGVGTTHPRVVEGYPEYSVHQHAMGPMALLDLRDAGGRVDDAFVTRSLRWPAEHRAADGVDRHVRAGPGGLPPDRARAVRPGGRAGSR